MARLKIGVIPIEGGHYYREALEEVTRAEELGFESVWMEDSALGGVELERGGAGLGEQLGIMTGLGREGRVSSRARYYRVGGRLAPPPVRRPPPPVWVGGWGELTLKRAATLADNWIPGPTADLKRLLEGKQRFLDNRRAADRKSTRLNSSHLVISYAVFCLKKKNIHIILPRQQSRR